MSNSNPIKTCFEIWIREGNSPLKFQEFREEFNKFVFIARIIRNYKNNKPLNTRLLLNHVIVLYNIFGLEITPIFFLVAEEDLWSELHSVLGFFDKIPEGKILLYDDYIINLDKYPKNLDVVDLLDQV